MAKMVKIRNIAGTNCPDINHERGWLLRRKRCSGAFVLWWTAKCVSGRSKNRSWCALIPPAHDEVMQREGVRVMDFTTKVMKGFAFVEPAALATDAELSVWVQMALAFNPPRQGV